MCIVHLRIKKNKICNIKICLFQKSNICIQKKINSLKKNGAGDSRIIMKVHMAKWPEVRSRCFRHLRQYHHHHRHRHSIRYERRAQCRRIPAGILDAFADFVRRVARKNLAFADRERCRKQIGVRHFCEHNFANQAFEVPVNRERR